MSEWKKKFQAEAEEVSRKLKDFSVKDQLSEARHYVAELTGIQQKIESLQAQKQQVSQEEQTTTAGQQIQEFFALKEPFDKLWSMAVNFQVQLDKWMRTSVRDFNPEAIDKQVQMFWNTVIKLTTRFRQSGQKGPLSALAAIKDKLENLKAQIVPIITALCNSRLRKRHWDKMSEKVGISLKEDMSLQEVLKLKLDKVNLESLQQVSAQASKEYALEKALEKMKSDWENVCFVLVPYKDTGLSILSSPADIQSLLDDHIIKTSTLKSSPFIGLIEKDILDWDKMLVKMTDTLEVWLKVQSIWLYLKPVFAADDIRRQFPKESKMFEEVEGHWRHIMTSAGKNTKAMISLSDGEISGKLQQSQSLLEGIQKGVNDYLEEKRKAFPRFYFLSTDDLLSILSQTRDPVSVQSYLIKVFEGIARLDFTAGKVIQGMESDQGEKVPFSQTVNPADSNGMVEKLLTKVMEMMRLTIRDITNKAVESYPKTELAKWVLQWPGQMVLAASQVHWTTDVTQAIKTNGIGSYLQKCTAQLQEVVNMVRGSLSKLDRTTLNAWITINVHARDIVVRLQECKTTDPNAFPWMSQLKYYQEGKDLSVQMITTTIDYANEYLGNTPRLVITPLTDRCYITLMSAYLVHLGGSPQGPAGTGKTETCKDLAKAIAKPAIVISCSDKLDYLSLGQCMAGLASSGAWGIFDEFNRIDIEALSAVAEQLRTIQSAVAGKMKKFMLGGKEMTLDPTCFICVTMNPGYAGRTELPDNLKAFFRPCAMMVPDYALIAEIMLYSEGFAEAGKLAKMTVQAFKMMSEQLSRQCHYDFGMRALKSVVVVTGRLKRDYPNEQELILMVKAFRGTHVAKFVAADMVLFEGIIADIFQGVEVAEPKNTVLEDAIVENISKLGLQPVPQFVKKVRQIYDTLLTRHGLVVVGDTMGGKTTAIKVLASALTDVSKKGLMSESEVLYSVINPKSVSLDQLYGNLDPVTHEWTDGVLTNVFREHASSGTNSRKWIVLDGPVDAIWVENLNAVLDDNKKLCTCSGEMINMDSKQNVMFEVLDLEVASPATVSRCGMVYVEPHQLSWEPLIKSFLATHLPDTMTQQQRDTARRLFDWLLSPCLSYVEKYCCQLVKCGSMHLTASMLKLYGCLLEDMKTVGKEGQSLSSEAVTEEQTKIMISYFFFSLVWSVGATLDSDSRLKFDEFFRTLCELQQPKDLKFSQSLLIPKKGRIYDYVYIQKQSGSWYEWNNLVTDCDLHGKTQISEVIINTMETERQKFFLDHFLLQNKPVLFIGPTGTGKSVVTHYFLSTLPKNKYSTVSLNFSASTTISQTQDVITTQLERRTECVYGPLAGKRLVVFVDDVNMPAKEVYGAQPPIEMLRQLMESGFWFDGKDSSKLDVLDMAMVAAMGPPGGGRNLLTPRFLRHFNIIGMNAFDDATVTNIFTPIVNWHFSKFETSYRRFPRMIVSATLEVYKRVITSFLPTPSKPHYCFNIRDFAKVVQGVMLLKPGVLTDGHDGRQKLVRLWLHEVCRVFQDRLVDDGAIHAFLQIAKNCAMTHFKESVTEDSIHGLTFGDYLSKDKSKMYDEILDTDKARQILEDYLEEYNATSKVPMDLVLFRYAMEHVSQICRVLKQPNGHCLLVGIEGSGRKSLAKLSAFISGFEVFQVDAGNHQQWRQNMCRVLRRVGEEGVPMVLLLEDQQIKTESVLEDVNMMLTSGDIPNLFKKEERVEIIEKMKTVCHMENSQVDQTPVTMYNKFVQRIRQNLHVILTFSPVGDTFRQRIRMFPALVNCCTVNWFKAWPEGALESVANKALSDFDMSEGIKTGAVTMCKHFHESATKLSERYYSTMRRRNYVTPTSYLELLKTFRQLMDKKRMEVVTLRNKYFTGVRKLQEGEKDLAELKAKVTGDKAKQAEKLITALADEKKRWAQRAEELQEKCDKIIGDVLLSAGVVAYLGPFTPAYREECLKSWHQICQENNIPVSEDYSLMTTLGDPVHVLDWHTAGLPADRYSVDSAIILMNSNRWPLLIDPEGQASKWIQNREKGNNLEIIKPSDPNCSRSLMNCIQFGMPCLLEDVGENMDSMLEPVLSKQTFKKDGVDYIRLGDSVIEYSSDFKLYMTTKLRNPHFSPDISVKVTLINFMPTPQGIEDLLLNLVVDKERPELAGKRRQIILETGAKKRQLMEMDDKLLEALAACKGSLLDDKTFTELLFSSRDLSKDICENQEKARQTEAEIARVKSAYQTVAARSSVLYFTVSDLANIDPMYQYSITWFVNMYLQSISSCKASGNLAERVKNVTSHFTYSIYTNVCQSLFEKDTFLFSFLLCIGIAKSQGQVDDMECRFLATGGVAVENPFPNPANNWLPKKAWAEIVQCSELPAFKGFIDHFCQNLGAWKRVYDSATPEIEPYPQPWSDRLSSLHKLIVLRCLRPDKMVRAVQAYIVETMGQLYTKPPTPDLALSFADSQCFTPLIFIMCQGADPMPSLYKFAEEKGMGSRGLQAISLGQGQGPAAKKMILQAMETGSWVVLQNCHLCVSWLGELEKICDTMVTDPTKIHKDFRLWLTSRPSPQFPVSVLQNSVRMTCEPETGLQASLLRSYTSEPISNPAFLSSCKKPEMFEKLLFGLCFFHAVVKERRKFGPIGWNIPYEFNVTDLKISVQQLQMFLTDFGVAPMEAMVYLTGEVNYGGRVTDDKDRRLVVSLLQTFYNKDMVGDDKYRFSESGLYYAPPRGSRDSYVQYIKSLPVITLPEAFGLHENAGMMKDLNQTKQMFDGLLLTIPKQLTSDPRCAQKFEELADDILSKLPSDFNLDDVATKYPGGEDSLNNVLVQECSRFNKLLQAIRHSLQNTIKAVRGQVVMTTQLQEVFDKMIVGKVPGIWVTGSFYTSLKPLGSYISDLLARLNFFQDWIVNGAPVVMWISAFMFPQSFMSAVLQNYAHRNKISFFQLDLQCEVINYESCMADKPTTGAYIRGLYMEGARWCRKLKTVEEVQPKILHDPMPVIWLKAVEKKAMKTADTYACPVYKVSTRRGVLSTTGHSTNFIMMMSLPSKQPQSHWIKRGVACLCQLDD